MKTKRAELKWIVVFIAVVEGGGFTAAATRVGSTKAMVSAQIRQLETELGLTLFIRTTRRVTLTEGGHQLYRESAPLLQELEAVFDRAGQSARSLGGTLRILVPANYLAGAFSSRLALFAELHPQLKLDLLVTDEARDLVREGIDLAVQGSMVLRDSTLRATKIGHSEYWVVGAPAFLAQHGSVRKPEDLQTQRWVAWNALRLPLTWTFSRGAVRCLVHVKATAHSNSASAVHELVREGLGISILPDYLLREDVAQGRLARLVPDWALPGFDLLAVYPANRHVPAKVRALVDFLRPSRSGQA